MKIASERARKIGFLAACACLTFAPRAWSQARWPDIDQPARKVAVAPQDAAVIAAVENYTYVSPVPGALSNANGWYDYFTKTLGIPFERVALLKDSEVTREELLAAVEKSAGQAGPGGNLWFVFIGHGAPSPDGKGGVLVGVDAQQRATNLFAHSLAEAALNKTLLRSQASSIRVFLDACFSGRDGSGRALAPGLQPLLLTSALPVSPRIVVLTAAKSDQFAGPLPGESRPAFSYLALGALRGWEGGKTVTAGSVIAYVNKILGSMVRGRNQEATLSGSATAVLEPSAGEAGPDLAALQKAVAGTSETESIGAAARGLPAIEAPRTPQSLGEKPAGMDWRALDVDALEAYNQMADFDKGPAEAPEKAAQWKTWAGEHPAYKTLAEERARAWSAYASQSERAWQAVVARYQNQTKDWDKLSRLLSLDVMSEKEKSAMLESFLDTYQSIKVRWEVLKKPALSGVMRSILERKEKLCAGGAATSCFAAGQIQFHALGDEAAAFASYRKACESGHAMSCANSGSSYGLGLGVPKDQAKALVFFHKACDMGAGYGCTNVGYTYSQGAAVEKDQARALGFFRKGCDMGDGYGCMALGEIYLSGSGAPKNESKALALFGKSCDVGTGGGCTDLGSVYLSGSAAPKDEARAIEFYKMGCDMYDGQGCSDLGYMHERGLGTSKDAVQAAGFYRRGCDIKSGMACSNLGVLYSQGLGVDKDRAKAFELFDKACGLSDGAGCTDLGYDYALGFGVDKNPAKAREFYKKGCDLGNKPGCDYLKALPQ